MTEITRRIATVHDAVAEDLSGLGGILRCSRCHGEHSLGNVAGNLRRGWPKCCGRTMTWVTQRQLDEEKDTNA